MIWNLVTGGAWYSEQDFDNDFVEVLSANCLKYKAKGMCA